VDVLQDLINAQRQVQWHRRGKSGFIEDIPQRGCIALQDRSNRQGYTLMRTAPDYGWKPQYGASR
jgi:hypothetical protein